MVSGMREKIIENQIKSKLTTMSNVWYFKHSANATMKVGIPDLVCCINGYFIGIEVKQATGIQSEAQKVNELAIKNAGGQYWLVFSFPDFLNKLEVFLNEKKK